MKNILCIIALMPLLNVSSAQLPTKGLIAHYKFNRDPNKDSLTVFDAGSYRNHGEMYGGVSYTEDRYGNGCSALWFDGRGYVSVPSSNSLKKPEQAFSAAVWFKLAKGADFFRQWITICCKSDSADETPDSPQYRMQATAQTVSINTEFTENFTPQLSYNVWYFYAYTYDGNKVRVFLDGKFVYEYDYSGDLVPNDMPLEIGRDLPGGLEFYFGTMDDLRLYDRALDESELLQLFNDYSEASAGSRCPQAQAPPVVSVPAPKPTPPQKKDDPVVTTTPDPTTQTPTPKPTLPSKKDDPVVTTTPDPTTQTPAPKNTPPQKKDDPVVTTTPDPITPTPSPPVQPAPVDSFKNLPNKIGQVPISYQKIVHVKSREVTIYPYDNEKEDGDIVSINVNGVWVRDKYQLKNKVPKPSERLLIRCSLNPGDYNYFISKAWNVGTIPPNTLTIEINDGLTTQKVLINSDVGLSGGIKIVCEE